MPTLKAPEVSVELLPGWNDGSQLVMVGPEQGGFRPNLVITRDAVPAGETPEKLGQRARAPLRRGLPGFKVAKEGPAKFGAVEGYLSEHSFSSGAQTIAQLQLFLVKGTAGYTLTFTHLAPHLSALRPLAEKAFGSVKL